MPITLAEARDIPALVDLVNAAYRGERATGGWTHEAGLLEGQRTDGTTLQADMAKGATVLVMRDGRDGALQGCVSLERKKTPGTWYLGMLTVMPERQNGGLGRALLAAGEAYAAAEGACRIEMTVIHLREALIAWYERRGYRRTGETAPFPADDARFGVPLRPDLTFVVLEKQLEPSRASSSV